MPCRTCDGILLRQLIASSRLHWETSHLVRLAGKNQPELFEAALRRCQQFREDCLKAEAALRAHRYGPDCTKTMAVDVVGERTEVPQS